MTPHSRPTGQLIRRPQLFHTARPDLVLTSIWAALLPVQIPLLASGGRPINFAPSDVVLAVSVVVLFPRLRIVKSAWSIWHIAFPLALSLSIITVGSLSRYSLFNKLIGMVILLLSYLLITSTIRSFRDLEILVWAFVIGIIVVNFVAGLFFLTRVEIPILGCQTCIRFIGFMSDANLYGSIVVIGLTAYLAKFALEDRTVGLVPRKVSWLTSASLIIGLIFTLSRSSWVASAVAALSVVLICRGRALRIMAATVSVVVLAIVALFLVFEGEAAILDIAARTHSVETRLELTREAVDAIGENPLFGIGIGRFPDRHGQIIHTSALWLAAELGVIGVGMFLGFAGWVASRLRVAYMHAGPRARPAVAFLIASNLAMLAFSFFVEALYQRHWWFVIALSATAAELLSNDKADRSETAPV